MEKKTSYYPVKNICKTKQSLLKKNRIEKSRSEKSLCLWPIPKVTRCIIFLSAIVSLLNFFGIAQFTCSSPISVIYKHEILNLFMAPFLCKTSLTDILIFSWNLLTFGLYEDSLSDVLNGFFALVFIGIFLSTSIVRQGLGYLFSRGTGWAIPRLFFHESLHECSQGLSPFLFSLLVVQSMDIQDNYILTYANHKKVKVRKIIVQAIMCFLNYATKNILWWSLTGLLTGLIVTVLIQLWSLKDKHCDHQQTEYLWETFKSCLGVIVCILSTLLVCNTLYSREGCVGLEALDQLSNDPYLFTFVIMTAPRRGDPPFLTRTLDSYLQNWPTSKNPLYKRMQALVYTHFTEHTEFDRARDMFESRQDVKWIREEGYSLDQRTHVSKALDLAVKDSSTYIALVEDDFPLCGSEAWHETLNLIYSASIKSPNHCGVFVGTGGSGLFMKPDIAKLVSKLLHKYLNLPPDIVIQQCLLGKLPECSQCSQTLVVSKTLLMYHIGYNTSTSLDKSYGKNEFQCGWRHPFNGNPDTIVL